MNSKGSALRLAIACLVLYAFYRVERDVVIFSGTRVKHHSSSIELEHTICNPHVLKEILRLTRLSEGTLERALRENTSDPIVSPSEKPVPVTESKSVPVSTGKATGGGPSKKTVHVPGTVGEIKSTPVVTSKENGVGPSQKTIPGTVKESISVPDKNVGNTEQSSPKNIPGTIKESKPVPINVSDSTMKHDPSSGGQGNSSGPYPGIPKGAKVVDTTGWARNNNGSKSNRPKVYSSLAGKLRPVLYVRSIHPMHIDLTAHVRKKIEEGIDIPVLPINPHPFKYINSPQNCEFEPTQTFNLLILVKSSSQNSALRNSIRTTWGNVKDLSNIKLVFLVAFNQDLQAEINKEAANCSDVIQEDFRDSYKNNTLKTIMGFNWAVEKCYDSDLLFFVDDDHFVRLKNLIEYLKNIDRLKMQKLYVGFRVEKPPVDRKDGSPWGLSNYEFSHILWPAYLRGGAFVVSTVIAHRFTIAFPYVKYLSVDDSFLGIVADKLSMLPQHDFRFKQDRSNMTSHPDYFVYNDYKDPQEVISVWQTISQPGES